MDLYHQARVTLVLLTRPIVGLHPILTPCSGLSNSLMFVCSPSLEFALGVSGLSLACKLFSPSPLPSRSLLLPLPLTLPDIDTILPQ